jgi:TetR/AcrR family fatty acid metabolism transcriptional regulator
MRRKEGNKEQKILDAAIRIFARKGFNQTKISEIADEAGIGVGSVYNYYKNKESILLHILERIWKNLYIQLEMICNDATLSIGQKFVAFIHLALESLAENKDIALLLSNEQNFWMMQNKGMFSDYYKKFKILVMDIIQEGKEAGVINASINAEIMATFLVGGIRYLIYSWQRNEFRASQKMLEEQLSIFISRSLFNNINALTGGEQ